jgi:hypothetical protein
MSVSTERGRLMDLGVIAPAEGETLLLRAALLDEADAAAAWAAWRARDTVASSHHRVHALLPLVVANVPEATLGDDLPVLRGLRRRAWLVRERQRTVLDEVRTALGAARVPCAPVGGCRWLTVDAERAADRPVSGVRLWVPVTQWDAAVDVLARHGYAAPTPPWPLSSELRLTGADGDPVVLTWGRVFPRLARSLPGAPTDASMLVESLLEGLDLAPHEDLLWPVDATLLIRSHGRQEGFWDAVRATADGYGQAVTTATVLVWLRDHLDVPVPEDVVAELGASRQDPRLADERRRAARVAGGPSRRRRRSDMATARADGAVPAAWPRIRVSLGTARRAVAAARDQRRRRTEPVGW